MGFFTGSSPTSEESVQDKLANALTDTATINFTYNDAANQITADVIPGGIDHGAVAGLADDDHTQYFKVTGRTNENLIISGTGKLKVGSPTVNEAVSAAGGVIAENTTTTGTMLIHNDSTLGPLIAGHTDSSNNSTRNIGTTRMVFTDLGARIYTSSTQVVGTPRTWYDRINLDTQLQMLSTSQAHILWSTDGAGNIGATGATRPDKAFVKTQVSVEANGSNTTPALNIGASGANGFFMATSSRLAAGIGGVSKIQFDASSSDECDVRFSAGVTRSQFILNNDSGKVMLDMYTNGTTISLIASPHHIPSGHNTYDLGRDPSNNVYAWRNIHGGGIGLGYSSGASPTLGNNILWGSDGLGDIGTTSGNRPGKVCTSDKVLAAGGIGVGNSAAATTPGSVIKKMEVFDASGTSLGFVAIYDSIT